jgi:esterase/lipase superfamily enzyme
MEKVLALDVPITYKAVLKAVSSFSYDFSLFAAPGMEGSIPRPVQEIVRVLSDYSSHKYEIYTVDFGKGLPEAAESTSLASLAFGFDGRTEVILNANLNDAWKRFVLVKEISRTFVADQLGLALEDYKTNTPEQFINYIEELLNLSFDEGSFDNADYPPAIKLERACEIFAFFLLYPIELSVRDLRFISDAQDKQLAYQTLADEYLIPKTFVERYLNSKGLESNYRFLASQLLSLGLTYLEASIGEFKTLPSRIEAELATSSEEPPKGTYIVWYGTDRERVIVDGVLHGFSSKRSESTTLGFCKVFIPETHAIGSVGSSWIKRIFKGDDRLRVVERLTLTDDIFWKIVADSLQTDSKGRKIGVVYVHGFNCTFDEAIIRAAQIGFDIGVHDCMAAFSWPSLGKLVGYSHDEASIEASEANFSRFLSNFCTRTGVEKLHVIAHSMGNRLLIRSLCDLVIPGKSGEWLRSLGQAVLAAPDVHQPTMQQRAGVFDYLFDRVTLYTSDRDRALESSGVIHQAARVGLFPPVFTHSSIDTVCVTNLDISLLGHAYHAESRPVLTDINRLVMTGDAPEFRIGLKTDSDSEGRLFWKFFG